MFAMPDYRTYVGLDGARSCTILGVRNDTRLSVQCPDPAIQTCPPPPPAYYPELPPIAAGFPINFDGSSVSVPNDSIQLTNYPIASGAEGLIW